MKKTFNTDEARAVGELIGANFDRIDLEQFRQGLEFELINASVWPDDNADVEPVATAHIVEINLINDPLHYSS